MRSKIRKRGIRKPDVFFGCIVAKVILVGLIVRISYLLRLFAQNRNAHIDIMYPFGYTFPMFTIKQTDTFSKWLKKLKDIQGKVAVIRRIDRMKNGNFGDHKPVGDDVSELRIPSGPGYRVYYTKDGDQIIILLIGGDKSSQSDDIAKAKKLAKELK
jgi:putative addiction module killer protein